jgi:hypothetical protein
MTVKTAYARVVHGDCTAGCTGHAQPSRRDDDRANAGRAGNAFSLSAAPAALRDKAQVYLLTPSRVTGWPDKAPVAWRVWWSARCGSGSISATTSTFPCAMTLRASMPT